MAELALEHDADAEARRHRVAHGLAAADLDGLAEGDAGLGHRLLEARARRRAHLAQHDALPRELAEPDAATPRAPGMAALDEEHEAVAAQGHGVEPLVGLEVGEHGDVDEAVAQGLEHHPRIAEGEGDADAGIAAGEAADARDDVIGPVGAHAQPAAQKPARRGEKLLRLLLEAELPAGDLEQRPAELGDPHAAPHALEELHAEAV